MRGLITGVEGWGKAGALYSRFFDGFITCPVVVRRSRGGFVLFSADCFNDFLSVRARQRCQGKDFQRHGWR